MTDINSSFFNYFKILNKNVFLFYKKTIKIFHLCRLSMCLSISPYDLNFLPHLSTGQKNPNSGILLST